MPSRRLQDVFSLTIFHLPGHLPDIFKTYLQDVSKMSSRRLGRRKIVTLKTFWRLLQDVLKTNKCLLGWYLFLGKGSFASTYKGTDKSKNVCVKTLHPTLDKEHVATFSKEAEIIQRTNNKHVVKLIAVSDNPITIMMEFCVFSFTQFDRDAAVNSLDEFLSYYDKEDLHSFFPTILHKISSDMTKAVQYIDSNNIVHIYIII